MPKLICDYKHGAMIEHAKQIIDDLEREIENLKAELEAAYESRELDAEQRRAMSKTMAALMTRKPTAQEMNEKKMGC